MSAVIRHSPTTPPPPSARFSSPLLLVEEGEQGPAGHILGDDGELAGVVQTRPHELDDTRVVEAAEDGDLPAEHVHV